MEFPQGWEVYSDSFSYTDGGALYGSYYDHSAIWMPKSQWIVVENTHEAIIEREMFETVQRMMQERTRSGEKGTIHPLAKKVVCGCCFPGMKVLEFAFDDTQDSAYLPHKYEENCVVYTGTHDNNTLQGWYQAMDPSDREFSVNYLGNLWTPQGEVHWDFIRLALASKARLAVIPVQDYLGLGEWARVNEPSTLGKNWRWRMSACDMDDELIRRCRLMAKWYGRTR